jgi:DNA-binding beta-propeller fold protein YncE
VPRPLARRIPSKPTAVLVICAALSGCGSSDDLPPPGKPARSPALTERPAGHVVPARERPAAAQTRAVVDGGQAVAVLSPRERVLTVGDDRAAAGVGPTQVIGGRGGLIYVVDTTGDGLLVFERRPRLQLTRRLPLLGKPYGIAADPVNGRLWVTLTATNQLVELADGARPHRLRTLPAVRQPDSVAVDPRTQQVVVSGRADGVLQIVDGRDTRRPTPRTARR